MKVLYPGSFDPFTNGHLDILKRSIDIFGQVTIGIIENINKKSFFTLEERKQQIKEVLLEAHIHSDQVSIVCFQGLLVDLLKELKITTILRGVRLISDFETEMKLALNNKSLNPMVETIFLFTNPLYTHISSSVVKEVFLLNGDITSYVPPSIKESLKKKKRNVA